MDTLPGARPIYEGVDYSGNVALTGEFAKFESANSDVNANLGIQCNRAAADCYPNPGDNNSYYAPDGDSIDPADLSYNPFNDVQQNLNELDGVSQFDPAALIGELELTRDFIVGLDADTTWDATFFASNSFENQNFKENFPTSNPITTDLDAIDTNSDGIAVIDIDMDGEAFQLINSDWILETTMDTLVIFRMADGTQFDFSNSSILLGDGTDGSTDVISELGAIFFMDAYKGTNELFNLSNVILGGIGLWDFTDLNTNRSTLLDTTASSFAPVTGDATMINLQNAQGCAQFISHEVLMSNNRWNRCALASSEVDEPGVLGLMTMGMTGLVLMSRRRRKRC